MDLKRLCVWNVGMCDNEVDNVADGTVTTSYVCVMCMYFDMVFM